MTISEVTDAHLQPDGAGGAPPTGPPIGADGIADFTPDRDVVRFRIGEDVFQGVPEVPALAALRFAAHADEFDRLMTGDDEPALLKALEELFSLLLVPESSARLLERMNDPENGIGLDTFNKVLGWVMEQYGMRPTLPSDSSPSGPPNPGAGPSLTDTSSEEGPTSSPSGSTDS